MTESLIYERSRAGRRAYTLPPRIAPDRDPVSELPTDSVRQTPLSLPEVSKVDVVRHFTRLSQETMSIDANFYPLGSCTMKHNPMLADRALERFGLAGLHPHQEPCDSQGLLRAMHEMESHLAEVTGLDAVSLVPAAGAQGEYVGLAMIREALHARGENRHIVLVPDTAHGTNPASAALAGLQVEVVSSTPEGLVDVDVLEEHLSDDVAALMLTNPNTLGLFERDIEEIAKRVHEAGAMLYYDGANLNALAGRYRPGDMGFDVCHLNLHKTFATPHGGGGPGAGPVAVGAELVPFLPTPRIRSTDEGFELSEDYPQSIGPIHGNIGNVGVVLRAFVYLRVLGREGLRDVSAAAVLNANYLRVRLSELFPNVTPGLCMHEFTVSLTDLGENTSDDHPDVHVRTMDVAKRLLDLGFHPPTVYFPTFVPEGMLIEPTETETKETLDDFVEAMARIKREAEENPELVTGAPHSTPIGRLDDVTAARKPVLAFCCPPTS